MKKVLGICDSDSQYAELLRENLGRRENFPFEVSSFETGEAVSKAVNKGILSVLLIAESVFDKYKETNFGDTKIVILNEGYNLTLNEDCIWKYQSSELIRKELLSILSKDENIASFGMRVSKGKGKVIGVYSLSRIREVSSFAISLGKQLSKKEKVLYISFKGMSAGRNYLDINENKDITDLIYYQRNAKDRFMYSFEEIVSSDKKLDYITPAYSFVDVKSVPKEDWLEVISQIRNCCDYSFVILELSEIIDGFLEVLRNCDQLVMLCEEGEVEGRVMKEFNEILESMDYGDIVNKRYISVIPGRIRTPANLDELSYGDYAEYVGNEMVKICSMSN